MKKIFSIGLCLLCTSIVSFAQSEAGTTTFGRVVAKSQMPEQTTGFTNSSFMVFPYSPSKVYSLKGLSIVSEDITNIRKCYLSPARNDIAIIYGNKKQKVVIYSATKINIWKKNIKAEGLEPVCLAYSPDSKTLSVASTDNFLYVFETQKYTLVRKVQIDCIPSKIIVSPNNFFVVAIDGQNAKVINFETGALRKNINCSADVTDIAFSLDGNMLGVLSKTKLSTFNGKTLEAMKEYTHVGNAIALAMHDDNKHAAIVTDEEHVTIVNVLNTDDHEFFNVADGGVTTISCPTIYTGETCIINDSRAGIMFSDLGVLEPNYGQLVSEELSARLSLWEKRMPGESLEEYNSRVNDESRNQMRNTLRDEIIGKMASGLFDANDISLSYDPKTQLISIGFKKMPTITLGMLENEARSLMKPGNI
ncbi:MAG: WD40 repeat domain-containing protein, partial [Prevotellaceae bacterium]|nr:WD40 repeat domain-containing protein [Prevotellaceae bacterium]